MFRCIRVNPHFAVGSGAIILSTLTLSDAVPGNQSEMRRAGMYGVTCLKWTFLFRASRVIAAIPRARVTHASAQRKEILQLKRLLAEKAMEVDFLKGALQKVEARRQRSSGSGGKTSTNTFKN